MNRVAQLALAGCCLLAAGAGAQLWGGPAAIEVRVEDHQGKPAAGAEVRLVYLGVEPADGPAAIAADARGRAVLGGLAEGLWRLEVARPGFMTYRAEVEVRAGKPRVVAAGQHNVPGAVHTLSVRVARGRGGAPPPPEIARREPPPVPREPPPAPPPQPAPPVREPVAPPVEQPAPEEPAPPPVVEAPPAQAPPSQESPPAPEPAPAAPSPSPPAGAPVPEAPPVEVPPAEEVPPAVEPPPVAAPPVQEPPPAPPSVPPAPAPEPAEPPAQPPPEAAPPPVVAPAPPPGAPAPAPPPPPPAVPEPPAPPPQRIRSYDEGTCADCRPGEAAASVVAVVQPPSPGDACAEALRQAHARARSAGADEDVSSGLPRSCPMFEVRLAPGVRYTGYRYEVQDGEESADCLAGRECPVGDAVWPYDPVLRRSAEGETVLATGFENRSPTRPRRAVFTVYYVPARGKR